MRRKRDHSETDEDDDDSLSSISDRDSDDGEPDFVRGEVESSLAASQEDEEVPSWIRYMPRPPWSQHSSTGSITYQPSAKRIKVDPNERDMSSRDTSNSTSSSNNQSSKVVMYEEGIGSIDAVEEGGKFAARKIINKYRCNVNETAFLLEMLGNVK